MPHRWVSVGFDLRTCHGESFRQNRRNVHEMLRGSRSYAGKVTCAGEKNGSCVFTITQDICVAVPVEFGATATVGDTFVSCNAASADDICTGCGTSQPVEPNSDMLK